jgi:ADP-L-glycero-D-manno-heptose 6-epimerase
MAILDSQSKVLVTGGAGFIGSALIAALNARGVEDIVVVDILGSDGKWKNLTGLRFRDYLEYASFQRILDEPACKLREFDFLFHLGACSATTERNASYLVENNYSFTRNLAQLALANNIRFVYASSAATYGDGSAGMDDREPNLYRFRPLNMYGYSKHLFDIHAWRAGWLEHIVGLKYFNVFGPNEYHKGDMRSLVCKAHEQILETGKIQLFKSYRPDFPDGGQMRDFLYVKDAVAMTLYLAENPSANGLFNIGSGIARTWLDLAHALFGAMGLPPVIEFIDMPASIRDQYQYFTRANISKLRETGYTAPVTSLEDAVCDYVQNYLSKGAHLDASSFVPAHSSK